MTTSPRPSSAGWLRLLTMATIATLTVAACGSDDATPPDTDQPTTTEADQPSDDDPASPEPVVDDDEGYEPTVALPDITDPKPHPIDDVVVSEDGDTLGIRYEAASEPCSGAVAEVVETDDDVTVALMTGLNPDAATMTCIAAVLRYELAVPLDEPLGDRELIVDDPTGDDEERGLGPTSTLPAPPTTARRPADHSPTSGAADTTATTRSEASVDDRDDEEDGSMDGLSPPGAFIGLTLDGAKAKAVSEGRPWRIGRVDDETYALTADYNPDRVTFDVDTGIVTNAVSG